jgi:mRNA interferase RelE/StbE
LRREVRLKWRPNRDVVQVGRCGRASPGRRLIQDSAREARDFALNRSVSLEYSVRLRDIIAVKTIVLMHAAAKDLDGLPEDAREFVMSGLMRYAISGDGDVKRLSGKDGFRLRIGRYRVIFDEDATTILALYIGNRETRAPTETFGRPLRTSRGIVFSGLIGAYSNERA